MGNIVKHCFQYWLQSHVKALLPQYQSITQPAAEFGKQAVCKCMKRVRVFANTGNEHSSVLAELYASPGTITSELRHQVGHVWQLYICHARLHVLLMCTISLWLMVRMCPPAAALLLPRSGFPCVLPMSVWPKDLELQILGTRLPASALLHIVQVCGIFFIICICCTMRWQCFKHCWCDSSTA